MADSPHTDSIPAANNVAQLTPNDDLIQTMRSAWRRILLCVSCANTPLSIRFFRRNWLYRQWATSRDIDCYGFRNGHTYVA